MRQFLVIDADDTLWENNIYFERAFESFFQFLNHSSMSAEQVRAALDQIELANIQVHGYGAANFARNLCQCYEALAERDILPEDRATILLLAEEIMRQPIETIEGVEETLQYLSGRHELTLFTKGHPEEQKLKVDRSGLFKYFQHTAIVHEKDAPAYRLLVAERGMEPSRTWMIGNSPKSDINPALAAGINAVYVPHDRTWHLERTDLLQGIGQLIQVERFLDLQLYF